MGIPVASLPATACLGCCAGERGHAMTLTVDEHLLQVGCPILPEWRGELLALADNIPLLNTQASANAKSWSLVWSRDSLVMT